VPDELGRHPFSVTAAATPAASNLPVAPLASVFIGIQEECQKSRLVPHPCADHQAGEIRAGSIKSLSMPGRHGFSQFYDAGDIYADLAAALTIRGAPRKIAIPVRAGRTGRKSVGRNITD